MNHDDRASEIFDTLLQTIQTKALSPKELHNLRLLLDGYTKTLPSLSGKAHTKPQQSSNSGHHHHHGEGEECCGSCDHAHSHKNENDHDDDEDLKSAGSECDAENDEEESLIQRHLLLQHVFSQLQKYRGVLKRNLPPFGQLKESLFQPTTDVRSSTAPDQRIAQPIAAPSTSSVQRDAPMIDVDAFLYDEQDIDDLCAQQLLSREYCQRCGGMSIGQTEFISHSFSMDQLLYLVVYGIPWATRFRRAPLQLCDVGSRLGIVVAAAFFSTPFSFTASIAPFGSDEVEEVQKKSETMKKAENNEVAVDQEGGEEEDPVVDMYRTIVGVEINPNFCEVQRRSLQRLNVLSGGGSERPTKRVPPSKRPRGGDAAAAPSRSFPRPTVELVESDVLKDSGLALLRASNVIVLHNVFEWFVEPEAQLSVWTTLRKELATSGTVLVCVPSFVESITVALQQSKKHHHAAKHKELRHHLSTFLSKNPNNAPSSSSASLLSDEALAKQLVEDWVELIDMTIPQRAFLAEHLSSGRGGEEDEEELDEQEKSMRDESMELVQSIVFYRVR